MGVLYGFPNRWARKWAPVLRRRIGGGARNKSGAARPATGPTDAASAAPDWAKPKARRRESARSSRVRPAPALAGGHREAQSSRTFAVSITFFQRACSVRTWAANWAGVLPTASAPWDAKNSCSFVVRSAATAHPLAS